MSTSLKPALATLLALAALVCTSNAALAQHAQRRSPTVNGVIRDVVELIADEYEDEYEDEFDDEDEWESDDEDEWEGDEEDNFFGPARGHGHGRGVVYQNGIPRWLPGKWLLVPAQQAYGAPRVEYRFASNGVVTKSSKTITYPSQTITDAPLNFSFQNGKLTIGATRYDVSTSGTRMTLTSRTGRQITLQRVN